MADLNDITVDYVTDNAARCAGLRVTNGTNGGGVECGAVDGSGYIALGDWVGDADNVWVIVADDGDNYLKFMGTETDQTVATLALQGRGTTLGTNYLRAYMRGNGSFVAPHEARYYSSWYAVNADDLGWNTAHGLSPAPTVGWVETCVGNTTASRTTGHYAQTVFNVNDDLSTFAYDATGWATYFDDDLSFKSFHSQYTTARSAGLQSTGFQFRVVLM